jgi:hypothetical protein
MRKLTVSIMLVYNEKPGARLEPLPGVRSGQSLTEV